ncbi:MAG: hypothetical protein HC939_22395 [Pleurocapsa sp. SU_5_0]|nr:hypothetical protein [Pleurocapsa sp. SU_5_0]
MIFNHFIEFLNSENHWKTTITIGSFFISVCSFYFSRKSWSDTYRPIITVRVATNESGNIATTLNLIVENFGNRPAKNIKLSVDSNKLESVLLKASDNIDRKLIERCFADETIIPLLANGQSISNSFGCLNIQYKTSGIFKDFPDNTYAQQSDWKPNARLDIQINYEDLMVSHIKIAYLF